MDFRNLSTRLRRYRATTIATLCLVVSAIVASPLSDFLTRWGADFLLPLAVAIHDERTESDVVLVVIDEVTHASPPFSTTPEVAWTPQIGAVIDAVGDAKPAVIGVDLIFSKTLDQRGLAPGYDRPFLSALARHGRAGRLVLGEARLSDHEIRPHPGQVIAVGGADNIRPVHFAPDADNVVRRLPAGFLREDGSTAPSFAMELAKRAGAPDTGDIHIDFVTAPTAFRTFRLADLYACLESDEPEVFSAFAGKTVIIGSFLDIEDRHVAGDRFLKRKLPPVEKPACAGHARAAPLASPRASVPGALIEARAVHTVIEGHSLRQAPRWLVFLASVLTLTGAAALFLTTMPLAGFAGLAVLAAADAALGALLLKERILAPHLPWLLGAFFLYVAVYAYRVLIEGREKRWITHAFQHYLSPALVRQLANDPDSLRLGGERRRAAVLFADLSGFTGMTQAASPENVVERLNAFFQITADIVEAHGGYVDKFIGDAVMAVWGAPVSTSDPETQAAQAALSCLRAIEARNKDLAPAQQISLRIGISAGDVVAGNLGSSGRFNYTVVGDAVNRAARLEEACKEHNARILVDEDIADRMPPEIAAHFVAEKTLRGFRAPSRLYSIATQDAER